MAWNPLSRLFSKRPVADAPAVPAERRRYVPFAPLQRRLGPAWAQVAPLIIQLARAVARGHLGDHGAVEETENGVALVFRDAKLTDAELDHLATEVYAGVDAALSELIGAPKPAVAAKTEEPKPEPEPAPAKAAPKPAPAPAPTPEPAADADDPFSVFALDDAEPIPVKDPFAADGWAHKEADAPLDALAEFDRAAALELDPQPAPSPQTATPAAGSFSLDLEGPTPEPERSGAKSEFDAWDALLDNGGAADGSRAAADLDWGSLDAAAPTTDVAGKSEFDLGDDAEPAPQTPSESDAADALDAMTLTPMAPIRRQESPVTVDLDAMSEMFSDAAEANPAPTAPAATEKPSDPFAAAWEEIDAPASPAATATGLEPDAPEPATPQPAAPQPLDPESAAPERAADLDELTLGAAPDAALEWEESSAPEDQAADAPPVKRRQQARPKRKNEIAAAPAGDGVALDDAWGEMVEAPPPDDAAPPSNAPTPGAVSVDAMLERFEAQGVLDVLDALPEAPPDDAPPPPPPVKRRQQARPKRVKPEPPPAVALDDLWAELVEPPAPPEPEPAPEPAPEPGTETAAAPDAAEPAAPAKKLSKAEALMDALWSSMDDPDPNAASAPGATAANGAGDESRAESGGESDGESGDALTLGAAPPIATPAESAPVREEGPQWRRMTAPTAATPGLDGFLSGLGGKPAAPSPAAAATATAAKPTAPPPAQPPAAASSGKSGLSSALTSLFTKDDKAPAADAAPSAPTLRMRSTQFSGVPGAVSSPWEGATTLDLASAPPLHELKVEAPAAPAGDRPARAKDAPPPEPAHPSAGGGLDAVFAALSQARVEKEEAKAAAAAAKALALAAGGDRTPAQGFHTLTGGGDRGPTQGFHTAGQDRAPTQGFFSHTPPNAPGAGARVRSREVAPLDLSGLNMRFRGLWDASTGLVSHYLAHPLRIENRLEICPYDDPAVLHDAKAAFELDMEVARRTAADAKQAFASGRRFVLLVPASKSTLMRHRHRAPFLSAWADQPEELRKLTRFVLHQIDDTASRAELQEMSGVLRSVSRPPLVRLPLTATFAPRLSGLGMFGVLYDFSAPQGLHDAAWLLQRLKPMTARTKGLGLKVYVAGARDRRQAELILGADADYLEVDKRGALTETPPVPPRLDRAAALSRFAPPKAAPPPPTSSEGDGAAAPGTPITKDVKS